MPSGRTCGILSAAIAAAAMFLGSLPSAAHPADMIFQAHDVKLDPQGLSLTWTIKPGPLLVPYLWNEADEDGGGAVSAHEARQWVEAHLSGLEVLLDGKKAPLEIQSIAWPSSFEKFQVGDEFIEVILSGAWQGMQPGKHAFLVRSAYESRISSTWFSVSGEGLGFWAPEQTGGLLELALTPSPAGAGKGKEGLMSFWESGTPALPGVLPAPADRVQASGGAMQPKSMSTLLSSYIKSKESSLSFFLFALAAALLLGGLHALAPGHGKTIVAAYLVGSRGTMRHAAALGGIVTLTHTGSVLLLGIIALAASRSIMPARLFPALEIASGLLILGLGAWLLWKRARDWRRSGKTGEDHKHPHDHHLPPDASWRSLLALGVSGGLVPCPDAIAILLVAVAIHRVAFGLLLIVAFSAGLSLVLIAIGIVMVQGMRVLQRAEAFRRLVPVLPVVSAAVILALGLVLTVGTLRAGLSAPDDSSAAGHAGPAGKAGPVPFLSPDLGGASILYMAPDDRGRMQLFVLSLSGGRPLALTSEPHGVWAFDLSKGGIVVYAALLEKGATELWRVGADGMGRARLLACHDAVCGSPVLSPAGERILYERREKKPADEGLSLSSIWWLDPATGDTDALFRDSGMPGTSAAWSSDGQWMSYLSPGSGKIQVVRLEDKKTLAVPGHIRKPAVWSPQGRSFIYTDLVDLSGSRVHHLMLYDADREVLTDLTKDEMVQDLSASWSVDGKWIAVARRSPTAPGSEAADQIWIMAADGSGARPVTQDAQVSHASPVWSPDGRFLLVTCARLQGKGPARELRLVEVETGTWKTVVTGGSRPVFLY